MGFSHQPGVLTLSSAAIRLSQSSMKSAPLEAGDYSAVSIARLRVSEICVAYKHVLH